MTPTNFHDIRKNVIDLLTKFDLAADARLDLHYGGAEVTFADNTQVLRNQLRTGKWYSNLTWARGYATPDDGEGQDDGALDNHLNTMACAVAILRYLESAMK